MSLKISIIIPVYNAEKYIEKCIRSIIEQRYNDIEIVVVDNGSIDNSMKIIDKLSKEFSCIRLIICDKKGVSNARNAGLDAVSGDIIGFADADDYFEPDVFHRISETFEKNINCDIIVCGYYRTESDLVSKKAIHYRKNMKWSCRKYIRGLILDSKIFGSLCNKFYRKNILKGYYFYPELSMAEDVHFNIRVALENNVNVYVLNNVVYNYVQNADSATHNFKKVYVNGENNYVKTYERILKDCKLSFYEKILVKRKAFYVCIPLFEKLRKENSFKWKYIKKYAVFYFMTFYVAPIETVKIFVKLIISFL